MARISETDSRKLIAQAVAVDAFRVGFTAGSDRSAAGLRRRHAVDAHVWPHWRHGYEVGRAAAELAESIYRKSLATVTGEG